MSDLLKFNNEEAKPVISPSSGSPASKVVKRPALATTNPYTEGFTPKDIFEYLPYDGSQFGMFSDPYAKMVYVDSRRGNHNGRYWLQQRMEGNSFTETELALLKFLAEHRCATRNQILRAIFKDTERPDKVRDFLKKCRQRGIICSFSWVSPLNDGKKKPLVYGLTRVGAEAAENLYHIQVPQEFRFQPVEFSYGQGPNMTTFFIDLASNELYAELEKLDRIIEWERRKPIRLEDSSLHYPSASMRLIADEGQFVSFWLEIVRITPDWEEKIISRFKRTNQAFNKVSEFQKPSRLIVITDSDARIPYLGQLAEVYMPDVKVRFTTDERLLAGLDETTFLGWDKNKQVPKVTTMSFLTPEHTGMTATDYFAMQQLDIEDEDEDEDYDD